jgi:hypothetical protein
MKKPWKVHKVLSEFKLGTLHSGSKKGPKVKSRKQAIAIALSEAGLSKKNPAPPFGSGGIFKNTKVGIFS